MQKKISFKHRYGPWCVIAGASTGIGASYSESLASAGLNLILIALKETGVEELALALESKYQVKTKTLELDLADPNAIALFEDQFQHLEIGLLVYVACHSVIGEFVDTSHEDKLKIIDVNVKAPLEFSDLLAPQMVQRGKGGIILMSSMSGWQGTSMVSTYAATKAFNTNLAEGLWVELKDKGVDVLAVVAGATHTPTFNQLTPLEKQKSVYPMEPDEVVTEALNYLGKGPTRITGRLNRIINFFTNRLMSRKSAIQFISANTERVYKANVQKTERFDE